MTQQKWWESGWFLTTVVLLSAVPLIWPETPPLVDAPGHIGRYRVQLDLHSSTDLQQFFEFKWRLIGNLGVDLLIIPLAPLLGLEPSVKFIVAFIPPLTISGIFWTAREVHGRIPPTALFAAPFAYGYPFNFGFINFAMSMALALLAFALWLRLTRLSSLRLRAAVFAPLSCALWVVHAFGWGALGLMVWSSELIRYRDSGKSWARAGVLAAAACLPLSLPLILMLGWRSGEVAGKTIGYFQLGYKVFSFAAVLRDRWLFWDTMSAGAALVLIGSAIFDKHVELSRRLAIPAAVFLALFILMPRLVFGSAFADMRLAPLMLILGIAAIRISPTTGFAFQRRIATLGLIFVILRLTGNTISFAMADVEARAQLTALNKMPKGARVLVLISNVGNDCRVEWPMPRHSHLGSFVIARKFGFSNDQWQLPGAQLLRVKYAAAAPFAADPSEVTYSKDCLLRTRATPTWDRRLLTADQALDQFPRNAFDFVWLLRPAGFTDRNRADLQRIWSGPDSALYRVVRSPRSDARAISSR